MSTPEQKALTLGIAYRKVALQGKKDGRYTREVFSDRALSAAWRDVAKHNPEMRPYERTFRDAVRGDA